MQIHRDGPRLILRDMPDRESVGFLSTMNGRRLMLALLLTAMVVQVFEGHFFVWNIPSDWRPIIAAWVIAVFAVLELCSIAADRKALTTIFDAAGRTMVQRGPHGFGTLERHVPFSAIAGVEIANSSAGRWWPSESRYVLQARLTTGEVWPLTAPSIL